MFSCDTRNDFAVYVISSGLKIICDAQARQKPSNLRNWGGESLRTDAKNCFYPIYVRGGKVVGFGDVPPDDFHPGSDNVLREDSTVEVWPLDRSGIERKWRYARQSVEEIADDLQPKATKGSVQVMLHKKTGKYKTVWVDARYDGSVYGTRLVRTILGRDFPFPKSVYTVYDNLASCLQMKKDALILDFFAGSGTTFHATALLNAADGGSRRCILVTNNEVSEGDGKQLTKDGVYPGDPEFEKRGICEAVTWPRCKYVTQGHRDDGTPLPGSYLDGREMKEGFEANIEYFRLDFLDPHEVAYGEKFEAILPILWLMAGANGERETARGYGKWFVPRNSPYAVLIKEEHFADFRLELEGRPDIGLVFLVTDSEEAFREMSAALPGRPETKMLYKSYLDNFRINTEKSL